MKFLHPFVLAFLFLMISCQQNPVAEKDSAETVSAEKPDFEISTIENKLPCADDSSKNCLTVLVEVLKVNGGGSEDVLKRINTTLEKELLALDNSEVQPNSPQEMADNFAKEYQQILTEMPNYGQQWEYTRNASVFLNEQGLFGANFSGFTFSGGAHGLTFTYFYLFDSDNGKLLSLEDLLQPKMLQKLKASAEMKFREIHDLEETESLEDEGFFFENDTFELPATFEYSKDGLLLFYNTYEVAPYYLGLTELNFSSEEIKDWVRAEYRL